MDSRAGEMSTEPTDDYEPPAVADLGTLEELTQGVQPSGADTSAIFSLDLS